MTQSLFHRVSNEVVQVVGFVMMLWCSIEESFNQRLYVSSTESTQQRRVGPND